MNGKRVNVTPTRPVTHTRYSDLVGIRGHRNYYVNLLSGRITYKSRGTTIRTEATGIQEAKRIVEESIEVRRSGRPASAVRREKRGVISPALADVWSELMDAKSVEVAHKTMLTYKQSWEYGFGPFWASKTAADVHQHNLEAWKIWYLKTHPKRHVEKTVSHMGMLFRYMHRMGYISRLPDMRPVENLQETIDRFSRREKVGRVLLEPEIQKLLEAAQELREKPEYDRVGIRDLIAHRARLGILLAARAGLRKMEALALEWDRVNLQDGIIKRWSTKNMKWREIPVVPELLTALKIQRELFPNSPWVFPMPSNDLKHTSSQVFDKVWIQVKRRAGVTGRLRYHDLRHTFATKTAEDGWPPVVACEILDMSLKIYQKVYCKPSFDSKIEWVRKSFDYRSTN